MRGLLKFSQIVHCTVLLAGLAGFTAALFGQGTGGRGSISGTVTDSSGAVIRGVAVTALNTATGLSVTVSTTSSGTYVIPLLPTGTYIVNYQREGFKAESRTGIILVADESASENVVLAVGSAAEKVTVSANEVQLQTESAALSTTINETAIKELPLNGRNPASLVLLTPGTVDVLKTGAGTNQTYTTHPDSSGASANGGRQGSTYYLLDGSNNMDPYLLLAAPFPNADATQEFSVIGNNFDAQYGFSPGAVVSIVTKSGTNQWHGNGFEFLRNSALNASDYFSHAVDGLRRNQFGGSVGGPIVRDKLFIFGNYQETLQSIVSNSGQTFTPTAEMRQGNFASLCASGFDGNGICNDRSGGQVIDQVWQDPSYTVPYKGNIVPANQLNQAAVNILNKFVPPGADPTGELFVSGLKYTKNDYQYTIRADYDFSDRQRLSGHVFRDLYRQPAVVNPTNLLASDRSWDTNYGNYEGTYIFTIRPTIVNQAAFSYGREFSTSLSGQLDAQGKPICLSQFIPTVADPPGGGCAIESFPYVNGQTPSWYHRYIWNLTDAVTISKGKHLIVAGVDVQRMDMADPSGWLSEPIMSFDGNYTGIYVSDVLLGQLSSYEQGAGSSSLYNGTQLGIYAQDRIKVSKNLTASVGLRYEPFLPPVPWGGRAEYYRSGQQSTVFPGAPLGMVFTGDKGIAAGGVGEKNYFSPRVGLAWLPSFLPNTSIRSAFGLFSAPIDYSHFTHAGDNFPWSPTYSFSRYDPDIGEINLSNPWAHYAPVGGVSPFPPFNAQGPGLPGYKPPSNIVFPTPDFFLGYSLQSNFNLGQTASWNLSVEHQWKSNWLLRAAYVGSESWHQDLVVEQNPGINNVRLNPIYSNISQDNSVGNANYQSAQFTLEKRFANGLQFAANYTRSKDLDEASAGSIAFIGSVPDPFNTAFWRGPADVNTPNVLTVNWVYKTPSLEGTNPLVRIALGSWESSGIWTAQTGTPFSIQGGDGDNNSGSLVGSDVADRVPGVPIHAHVSPSSVPGALSYFNPAAFQPNAVGTFGNSGRNIITSPGIDTFDLGIDKNFPFRERYNVQFRWEMFNAFNHPTFGGPDTYPNDGINFGQIFSTNGNYPARVMQAALKLSF
jgi:hypothetical protein